MDSIGVQVGLLLALFFLLERLATARGWGGVSAAGVPVVTWLVVTAMVMWCVGVLGFVTVHALLFTLGTNAADLGFVVTVALLIATPFGAAALVRRATRSTSTHPR